MRLDEQRLEALRLANIDAGSIASAQTVVKRAQAYYDFLKGGIKPARKITKRSK